MVKPIVGKKININAANGIFRTDKNGFLKFSSKWSADSYSAWKLSVEDSSDFRAINYLESPISYTPENEKVTITDTIRIDVLKPITIRLKTSSNNADRIFLSVTHKPNSTSYGQVVQVVKRDFLTFNKSASPQLDTTIQVNVYSKAALYIQSGMTFKNPVSFLNRNVYFENFEKRDTVLIEF
jgi:hypothetical protein